MYVPQAFSYAFDQRLTLPGLPEYRAGRGDREQAEQREATAWNVRYSRELSGHDGGAGPYRWR